MLKRKSLSFVIVIAMLLGMFTFIMPAQTAMATWSAPSIPYPASIFWGGYSNNNQLVQDGAQWDYVKKYADGFHFHTAYWANSMDSLDIGPKFAWSYVPYNPKIMMEGGVPHPPMPLDGSVGNAATVNGRAHAFMLQKINSWGFNVNEICTNYNLYVTKMIKNYNPTYNNQDMLSELTGDTAVYPNTQASHGYWLDFYKEVLKSDPGINYSMFDCPIYFSWDGYPAASTSFTAFRDINITGNQLIQACLNSSYNVFGKKMSYFSTDCPYNYYTTYSQSAKIKAYESWLRSNGYKHSLTINADNMTGTPAEQDQQYHDESLAYIKLYQADGGRADRYLLESWYPWPNVMVPETQEYTYTNLVKDVIKYVKGIKSDGSLENADLQIKASGDAGYFGSGTYQSTPGGAQMRLNSSNNATVTYSVLVKNNGDTDCMPCLFAVESGNTGFSIVYKDGTTNITNSMLNGGYAVTSRLNPGDTKVITVEVTPTSASIGQQRTFDIVAYWNPQDPTGTVRDVASGSVTKASNNNGATVSTASPTTPSGLVNIPVPAPQGLYEAENATLSGVSTTNVYSGYTGTGFIYGFDAVNDYAAFTIGGGSGGNKKLLIHYANAQGGARSLSLYVNGTKIKQLSFPVVATGDWTKWGVLPVNVILNPGGNNNVKIQYDAGDNGLFNIDDIVVADSKTYEAEDATLSGVTNVSRASNDIEYVYDWANNGNSLTIPVRGGAGGSQPITIIYSNGSPTAKTLSLYVNGTIVNQLSFPATGSFSTWSTISGNISLAAGNGKNSVTFRKDSGDTGGVYIKYITVNSNAYGTAVGTYNRDYLQGVFSAPGLFGGIGYVKGWVNNGDYAQFTVYCAAAGTKTLGFCVRNESSEDKTLGLYVNGTRIKQLVIPPMPTTFYEWSIDSEAVSLNAGTNQIKLQKDSTDTGNVLVDTMSVADNSLSPSYTPNDTVTKNTVYEAEAGTLAGGVITNISDDANTAANEYYTGLGYTTGWNAVNASDTFTVDGGYGGVKQLALFYRNTSATDVKTASLYVNGNKIEQMRLSPGDIDEQGGSWSGCVMSVYKKYVRLNSGSNTIKVQIDAGDSGFNALDKITLCDMAPIGRSGWTVTASSQVAPDDLAVYAIDGNVNTRWTTGQLQANGQWFQIDMGAVNRIGKVSLETSGGNYPRGYSLYLSNDGVNWGSAVTSGSGSAYTSDDVDIVFPAQAARYIKIVQTGSSPSNWWSIHEVNVYGSPDSIKTTPQSQIKYESEDATLSGISVTGVYLGYTGTGFTYLWDAQNDSNTFTVNGGSGGNKTLKIRYANANGNTRTLSLYVNDTKIKQCSFPVVAPGDWTQWGTITETINLNPGNNNTVKLKYDSGDSGIINVDSIVIITPSQYESEDATLNGISVTNVHSGYTGTGFTYLWDAQNDSNTFMVDGGGGGSKALGIRYANANGNTRTLSLYVNGVKIKQCSFPVVAPGDWTQWSTITEAINLNPGSNTVKLQYDSGDSGIINVDNITIAAPLQYESENATLNGISVTNVFPGYTGTGFTYLWDALNDSNIFTVDGGSGGSKTLMIRYANANGNTRTLSLYVNGSKIKQCSFPVVAPGDWSQWGTITETISLNPGNNNTVKLQYDAGDDGIINLDNIVLY